MSEAIAFFAGCIAMTIVWFVHDIKYNPYMRGYAEGLAVMDGKRFPSTQSLVLTCDGCRYVGTYDTDFPCSGCIRREKDYYEQE